MRNRRKKLTALILCALCIAAQAMPAYAAGTAAEGAALKAEAGVTPEAGGTSEDSHQQEEPGSRPEDSQQSEEPGNTSGDSHQQEKPGSRPGDSQKSEEPGNTSGDSQQPEEPGNLPDDSKLPVPKKAAGLHTTSRSDTKVLLEWHESDDAVSYEIYRRTDSGSYKKQATVEKARYTDKSVVYGKTYRYRVVPYNAQGVSVAAAWITFSHKQAVNITKQKYTYNEMKADMEELTKAYSNYCELIPIGTSVEGRTIYDFAIGNPDAGKSLLVVSTLHAREYICSAMLMREIEYYLRNYNKTISGIKPADLLKNMQIHYIVMANPDGVTISQTTNPRWKANSRGVDLNRNFPAKGGFYPGGKKGAEGYSGKKALSEPEAKAIAAFTKDLKNNQGLRGVVNYHAMGQIVFGDCTDKRIKSKTQKMYQIARSLTGYRDAGSYGSGGKPVGGQYREYVMDMLVLPSITIEVGQTWAPCSYGEYQSVFRKNKLVVLKIAEAL